MSENAEPKAAAPLLCPTCGSRLPAGARKCEVCGTEFRSGTHGKKKPSDSEITLSLPVALAIVAVFTVLAVGLTYLATQGMGNGSPTTVDVTVTNTPTETPTPQPTATPTALSSPTPLPTIEYIVDVNDTLGAIAVRYDVSIQSILQLNTGINSQSILSVGQRIYLPQPTPTPSPEPTSTLPPAEATIAACDTVLYTVEANDTLGSIAANYNVRAAAIQDFNGLNSDTVFLGQVLRIPLCERNPTPGPSPTPTNPPPYPAPNLLLPQDGAAFSLVDDTVTLQWAAVGELRENESYRVTVEDITEGSGTRRVVDYVKDTKYIVPASLRPDEATPHIMRWWVQVVRQTGISVEGAPRYEPGGATSDRRDFVWSGFVPELTPTP
ncbi:MAG: LysM peptidoglycan-binding domain-containing protein [Anaerolineales bacterium]|nr:LysM peptidoglycan-binding domain-containing protein [Anaerolineales bacterium]